MLSRNIIIESIWIHLKICQSSVLSLENFKLIWGSLWKSSGDSLSPLFFVWDKSRDQRVFDAGVINFFNMDGKIIVFTSSYSTNKKIWKESNLVKVKIILDKVSFNNLFTGFSQRPKNSIFWNRPRDASKSKRRTYETSTVGSDKSKMTKSSTSNFIFCQ